jgi:hypothetical protein
MSRLLTPIKDRSSCSEGSEPATLPAPCDPPLPPWGGGGSRGHLSCLPSTCAEGDTARWSAFTATPLHSTQCLLPCLPLTRGGWHITSPCSRGNGRSDRQGLSYSSTNIAPLHIRTIGPNYFRWTSSSLLPAEAALLQQQEQLPKWISLPSMNAVWKPACLTLGQASDHQDIFITCRLPA